MIIVLNKGYRKEKGTSKEPFTVSGDRKKIEGEHTILVDINYLFEHPNPETLASELNKVAEKKGAKIVLFTFTTEAHIRNIKEKATSLGLDFAGIIARRFGSRESGFDAVARAIDSLNLKVEEVYTAHPLMAEKLHEKTTGLVHYWSRERREELVIPPGTVRINGTTRKISNKLVYDLLKTRGPVTLEYLGKTITYESGLEAAGAVLIIRDTLREAGLLDQYDLGRPLSVAGLIKHVETTFLPSGVVTVNGEHFEGVVFLDVDELIRRIDNANKVRLLERLDPETVRDIISSKYRILTEFEADKKYFEYEYLVNSIRMRIQALKVGAQAPSGDISSLEDAKRYILYSALNRDFVAIKKALFGIELEGYKIVVADGNVILSKDIELPQEDSNRRYLVVGEYILRARELLGKVRKVVERELEPIQQYGELKKYVYIEDGKIKVRALLFPRVC